MTPDARKQVRRRTRGAAMLKEAQIPAAPMPGTPKAKTRNITPFSWNIEVVSPQDPIVNDDGSYTLECRGEGEGRLTIKHDYSAFRNWTQRF